MLKLCLALLLVSVLNINVSGALTLQEKIASFRTSFASLPPQNLTPAQRANQTLQQLNLTQKVSLLHGADGDYVGNVPGISEFQIPAQKNNDGPQGFRVQGSQYQQGTSTQFPGSLTMAASFDKNVIFDYGDNMAIEFYEKGANIQLGPGVCLSRFPRNGRNFEYISGEDPYLGYHNVFQVVSGIQSKGNAISNTSRNSGIIATTKHWVDNNQEVNRWTVSVIVSDRVEMEMYFQPFMGGIDAGTGAIMCSYNLINGTYSCQHEPTLLGEPDTNIGLKQNLGFQGWVMSDWGGTHNLSIVQGLDQEMPGDSYFGQTLIDAVQKGNISESYVDASVLRILTAFYTMGIMDDNNTNTLNNNVTNTIRQNKAREFGRNGTVLLKNDNNLLPLNISTLKNIVIIGDQAQNPITGGAGSGQVQSCCVVTPLQAITQYASQNSVNVTFYDSVTDEGMQAAASADVTLIFIGNQSTEGEDLDELPFGQYQNALVFAYANSANNTIVVASSPSYALLPFDEYVNSILAVFMNGEQFGNAITDILFSVNGVVPSGKLPLTFPNYENEYNWTETQYPGIKNDTGFYEVHYSEGFLFGYRWYDYYNVTPKYCFGHGISYTTFNYSNLQVNVVNSTRTVTVNITNTGKVYGGEVAQLYLQFPSQVNGSDVGYPPKLLKGFEKVFLQPGETQTVTFNITDRDLSIFNVVVPHAWYIVYGQFGVLVGSSSCDIRLNTTATFPNVNSSS